jgi:glycosyltransferase involved in cell wall biosynthesis
MKLCYALLYFDPGKVDRDLDAYLDAVRAAHDLPQALAARGHEVSVVHLYPFDGSLRREQVEHRFVAPGAAARAIGRTLATGHDERLAPRTPAWRAISRILSSKPDVVHFFGTTLHLNLALLLFRRGRRPPPVVLHCHGGEAARRRAARALQAYGFARTARFVFTTPEQAAMHARARLLDDENRRVRYLMETSSRFGPLSRSSARRQTGMSGDPVFVWTARLHPLKDPATALRGFARIARALRDARLYVYFQADELLPALQAQVREDAVLRRRVHFRGGLPYRSMEAVYNSADFLLQASRREHSGCAVLDAMACGTIPVVTDIPPFRAMTGDGAVGVLFPPGDDEIMARRVLALPADRIATEASAVRAYFDRNLSFPTLARELERMYEQIVS